MKTTSNIKQDRELAKAAIAMYRAAEFACVACEKTNEEFANDCIYYACQFLEHYEVYDEADTQVIMDCVYDVLDLDRGKIGTNATD